MPSSETSSAPPPTLAGTPLSEKPPNSTRPSRTGAVATVPFAVRARPTKASSPGSMPTRAASADREHELGGAGVDEEADRHAVDQRLGVEVPVRGAAKLDRAVRAADHRGRQQLLAQHAAEAVGDDHHGEDQRPDREVAQRAPEPMPLPEKEEAADEGEEQPEVEDPRPAVGIEAHLSPAAGRSRAARRARTAPRAQRAGCRAAGSQRRCQCARAGARPAGSP